MKKQYRNRRSDSSCSIYSQHSNSLANLDQIDIQKRQQKYEDIERKYLVVMYEQLKQYDKQATKPQISKLTEWRNCIKLVVKKLRNSQKLKQEQLINVKNSLNELNQKKSAEIRDLRTSHELQIKCKINENEKKIIQLTNQFNKKQCSYKETINNFVDILQKSQKTWTITQNELIEKIKKTQQALNKKILFDMKNKQIIEQLSNFGCEIKTNNDDSLRSINLSEQQAGAPEIARIQSRRNTIDISSIQQIQPEEEQQNLEHHNFVCCLVRLIDDGFFTDKNKGNIKKIIQITKNMQQPKMITQQPIFPILIEAIKLNIDLDKSNSILQSHQQLEDQSLHKVNKTERKLII